MSQEHTRPDPGNGHVPGPDKRDADLTALALDQLTPDEYKALEERLQSDPEALRSVDKTRHLARLLRDSTAAGDVQPSEKLREAINSRLDELEKQDNQVTPCEKDAGSWKVRRWLVAASAVCALVVVGVSIHQASLFRRAADTRQMAERRRSEFVRRQTQLLRMEKVQQNGMQHGGEHVSYSSDEREPAAGTVQESQLASLAVQPRDNQSADQNLSKALAISQDAKRVLEAKQQKLVSELGEVEGTRLHVRGYLPPSNAKGPTEVHLSGSQVPSTGTLFAGSYRESLQEASPPSHGIRVLADNVDASVRFLPVTPPTDEYSLTGPVRIPALGWRKVDLTWDDGWWELDFEGKRRRVAPSNEQYDAIHENKFIVVGPETALSTFSIDVDTASYANVRRFLTHNTLPPPDAVRIEELVNYFQYDYPQPRDRHPFSVNMEVAGCPWKTDHLLLRIGLKGQEIDTSERPPSNLVFLLDVSGSMKSENKLPLLKRAMKMLVRQLSENDQVTIVTYAGQAGLRLDTTSGEQRAELDAAIDSLSAGGSTNGSAGIELAYQKAVANFIEEGTNRVILATDGDLNVGISDDEQLVGLIKDKAASGVFLTVLGFGTGNLKDSKLEKLADHGNGMYGYVDSMREARKVLVEQMAGSLVTIAKDVKIQVEFNPAEVRSYRLIGYENRIMAARDFHDDTKDAGEIGAGHTVTALYEIDLSGKPLDRDANTAGTPKRSLKYQQAAEPEVAASELTDAANTGELLTLFLRYKPPEGNESTMIEFPLAAQTPSFEAASTDFRFASMVAAFGMLLRGSQYCGDISMGAVEECASAALGEDPHGRRTEFVDLVRSAKQLRGE